jgi:hypothetical protein
MRTAFVTLLLPVLLGAMLWSCSSDNGNEADTQAPTVALQKPAAGDTVGTTSVTIVANAADNVGVVKAEFYIDEVLRQTVTAEPWQATIAIDALADGAHACSVKAYDAAGNVGTSFPPTVFIKGIRTVDIVYHMALLEIVTSANCVPCAPANEYYRTATQSSYYQERTAVIKYHAWFPRPTDQLWLSSQTWARPRITYLFDPIPIANASAPNAWADGATAGNTGAKWVEAIDRAIPVAAEAKIELSKQDQSGGVQLSIKVTGLTPTTYTDLVLHTVVTENNINYNDGNSENVHYDVMRIMLPDANGEAFTMVKDQAVNFSRAIAIDPGWSKDNLNVVVFVQSRTSKHILQTAKLSLK